MDVIGPDAMRERLDWPALIAELEHLLCRDLALPRRAVHAVPTSTGAESSLLLMPAWVAGETIGVKLVTYFPDNRALDLPTISAVYVAFEGATGRVQAVLDGEELTARRTAAVSALASKHLSRRDASRLLVVGTGQLSPNMALAHASVRPFATIEIWGRDPDRAEAVVRALADRGLRASACRDLEASARRADLVSCVTSATSPVLRGDWLKPGAHVDLVGSFRPDMREADDATIRRASIFVDTRAGAVLSGDLRQPLESGLLSESDIRSDLAGLVQGLHPGRTADNEITLFKSVGDAVQDLAAARLVIGEAAKPIR